MPKYSDVPGPMLALLVAMTSNDNRNQKFRDRNYAITKLGIDPADYDDMIAAMTKVDDELQRVRAAFQALEKLSANSEGRWSPDCPSEDRLVEIATRLSPVNTSALENPDPSRFGDVPSNMLAHWLALTTTDSLATRYKVEANAKAELQMTPETFALMMRHLDQDPAAIQTLNAARALFLKIAEDGRVWSPDCPRGERLQQVAARLDRVAGEP